MTGIKTIAVKFAAFAAVSGLLAMLLINTMKNGVPGGTEDFQAEFKSVSGLRIGDDIKAAGVRVGRVTGIEVGDNGAEVTFELSEDQKIYDNTELVMRYQNLLGQRYVALVPDKDGHGRELTPDDTIPTTRTNAGFDLTELLNGFRPLFEVLQPEDVNKLAESMIKVLQGESGTVEQLLVQTANLTDFIADRDQVIGDVMTNLQPVLDNLAGQGDEIRTTARELRQLMLGLAGDRKAIGDSIDGIGQLVGTTTGLLREVKKPMTGTSKELRNVAGMLKESRNDLIEALPAFQTIFEGLGRATSYENALNIYLCSFQLSLGPNPPVNLNGRSGGAMSEACR